MTEKQLIPDFGPLKGMKILGAGSLIAMPFAVSMLADFGAEVIQIERPGVGDTYRHFSPVIRRGEKEASAAWMQEARNRLSMTLALNMMDEDSKQIFEGMVRRSDIFMESLVWLNKFGISDNELLKINPKLVIVHISGYGRQEFGGDAEICNQASYDITGQAFSGYANYNGYPDKPPLIVKPAINDYITALFALFGALAAYRSAQITGQGQVVDVAQFEAQSKIMREAYVASSMGLGERQRNGSKAVFSQPWDVFVSRDGKYICIGVVGAAVYGRFIKAIGISAEDYPYKEAASSKEAIDSPIGHALDKIICDWVSTHDADDIERIMRENRVPCSRINSAGDCLKNSARL